MEADAGVAASFRRLSAAQHQRSESALKFVTDRPFADPDAAARKLVEIANAAEAVQDGRIHIELINAPFLNAGGTRPNTVPVSNTPSLRAGCGGMSPASM
jgi:CTP:molybdopterin cytidylyltransferase MocA